MLPLVLSIVLLGSKTVSDCPPQPHIAIASQYRAFFIIATLHIKLARHLAVLANIFKNVDTVLNVVFPATCGLAFQHH